MKSNIFGIFYLTIFLKNIAKSISEKKFEQGNQKLENTENTWMMSCNELSVTKNFTPLTFVTAISTFPCLDNGNADAVSMTVEISEMRQEIALQKQETPTEIKTMLMNLQERVNLKRVGLGTFPNSSTFKVYTSKSLEFSFCSSVFQTRLCYYP